MKTTTTVLSVLPVKPAVLGAEFSAAINTMQSRFSADQLPVSEPARAQLRMAVESMSGRTGLTSTEQFQGAFFNALLSDENTARENFKTLAACCFAAAAEKCKASPEEMVYDQEFLDWVQKLEEQQMELANTNVDLRAEVELQKEALELAERRYNILEGNTSTEIARLRKELEDLKATKADVAILENPDFKAENEVNAGNTKSAIVAEVKSAMAAEVTEVQNEFARLLKLMRDRLKPADPKTSDDLFLIMISLDGFMQRFGSTFESK